ncbi:glycosyltransferase [uncultured Vagococcus sp.]|uniref:glycosyltransferase n=1 Tax=uncultured Vagococcus sp. TaxID=189676 RepID=UPI0028D6D3D2|nr:glycosyltransferase [uncultured Vagococcus sp.]
MKKLLFFTAEFDSHIFPIIPLLKNLSNEYDVFCVGIRKHKEIIQSSGCRFVSYPKNYSEKTHLNQKNKILEEIDTENRIFFNSIKKNHLNKIDNSIIKGLESYIHNTIRADALKIYNFKKSNYLFSENLIDIIEPNLIFKDTLENYSSSIAKERNIKCIEYITNNSYGFDYLNSSKRELYSSFFNIGNDSLLSDSFFESLFDEIKHIYEEVSYELNIPKLFPYPTYNLKEKNNIIFSIPDLHSEISLYSKHQNFYFVHPYAKDFQKENNVNISEDLKKFINSNVHRKIAYISTGSFVNLESSFYSQWVKSLIKKNYKVIISSLKIDTDSIFIDSRSSDLVFFGSYLPQKYILENADVFINAGGANSIFESIYFGVPIIITPISPEQVMNGITLEKYGVARTLTIKGITQYTNDEALQQIEDNQILIKERMAYLKKLYWNDNNLKQLIFELIEKN